MMSLKGPVKDTAAAAACCQPEIMKPPPSVMVEAPVTSMSNLAKSESDPYSGKKQGLAAGPRPGLRMEGSDPL